MQDMTYDEFKNWAAENILSCLPNYYENADVSEKHIVKTGSVYDGLIVRTDENIAV